MTNHPTDEVLKVMVEAEAEQGSRGAGEQGSDSVTLDSSTESSDNDQAQLNSGADDEDRPTFQPSNPPHYSRPPVYVEGKGWLWAENPSTSSGQVWLLGIGCAGRMGVGLK